MNDPQRSLHATNWTILVVDDEPPVREVLRDLLAHGFPNARILDAADGVAALAILRTDDVDLVLTDQRMPAMDGVTLLTRVKTARPAAMRVLLTGFADFDTAQRAVNEGHVHQILQKPIAGASLVAGLAVLLERGRVARNHDGAFERVRTATTLARQPTVPFMGDLGDRK